MKIAKSQLKQIILEELTTLLNEAPPKPWKPKRGKGTTMGLKPPRGLKPPIRPTTPSSLPVVPSVASDLAGLEKLSPAYLKQLGIKEPPVAGPTQPDLQARGIVEPYGRLYKQPAAKYLGTKEGPGELVDLNAIKDEVAQYLSQYYTPATEQFGAHIQLPAPLPKAIAGEAAGLLGTAVEDVKAGMTPEAAAEALEEFDPSGLYKWKQREDYLAAVDLKAREIMASGGLNRMQMAIAEMGLGSRFDRDVISRLSALARPAPGEAGKAAAKAAAAWGRPGSIQPEVPVSSLGTRRTQAEIEAENATLAGAPRWGWMPTRPASDPVASYDRLRDRPRPGGHGHFPDRLWNTLDDLGMTNQLIPETGRFESIAIRPYRPYSLAMRDAVLDYLMGAPVPSTVEEFRRLNNHVFRHIRRNPDNPEILAGRARAVEDAFNSFGRYGGLTGFDIYRDMVARGELDRLVARARAAGGVEHLDALQENKLQYVVEEEYQKLLLEFKR